MRSVAVIAEFNPFHNGHAHLLREIRRRLGDDTLVTAIMSGWYVQRGAPAIADPYTRAEMALAAGFDLVLELPFPYSIGSAADFASAGVALADRLGCFDTLAFGCECDDIETLERLGTIRASDAYRTAVERARSDGEGKRLGYAALSRRVLSELCGDSAAAALAPNNTLAIEYLAALRTRQSPIVPLPVKRIGDGYASEVPSHSKITSAGAIRPLLSKENIDKIERYIEAEALSPLTRAILCGEAPVLVSNRLSDAILAFFIASSDGSVSPSSGSGADAELVRRLCAAARDALDLDDLLDRVSARSLTDSYIRRVMLRAFLGVTSSELRQSPEYTRVLGFRDSGRALLRLAKRKGNVALLTKSADYSSLPEPAAKQAARALAADRFCYLAMPSPRPAADAYRGAPRHFRTDSPD